MLVVQDQGLQRVLASFRLSKQLLQVSAGPRPLLLVLYDLIRDVNERLVPVSSVEGALEAVEGLLLAVGAGLILAEERDRVLAAGALLLAALLPVKHSICHSLLTITKASI